MKDFMSDVPEFYILGLPIETEVGFCHFFKVKDYPNYFYDLQIFSWSKDELIYKYTEINKDGSLNEFISQLRNLTLFEIVTSITELQTAYYNVFSKAFKDNDVTEVLEKINNENFSYLRNLIMKMNVLKEEKINPNPEIQRHLERSKRVKAKEAEKITFADIVSSVVGFNGLSYADLNEFTIYQLYMTYYRIAQIKNYDTSTLFATVSTEKISIENWSKHIDLFEEEQHTLTYDQFKKKVGSAIND